MKNKKKCLVVDDEKLILLYLKYFFEYNGFDTYSCLNVDDALHILKVQEIDLIITDINMPNKDGIQFLSEIKNDLATKDIPVFVISNNDDYDVVKNVMKLGAAGFIGKPVLKYHLDQIFQVVRK